MSAAGQGSVPPEEGYDPLLYALVHTGTPGDVAFYLRQCLGVSRVLELGCGYGRLVAALAAAGHAVTGLDLHTGLLELARAGVSALEEPQRRAVNLVQGDMRNFALEGEFDRILIPHSGLYCLLSDDEVEACLRCARQHLAPGGRLVLDTYAADGFHAQCMPEDYPDDQLDEVALIACDGVVYDVYERSTWDRDAQRMTATYVYVPDDGASPPREFAIEQRYLLRAQLEHLLARTGFRVQAVAGDFNRAPYDDDSELLALIAAPA